MKYIDKNQRNEPQSLRAYRDTTPNATYSGFTDSDHHLKNALLNEQGHICAYCNGRISTIMNAVFKPKIEIEHYLPQEKNPELSLKYENLLGVCNGVTKEFNEHCDKSKKSSLLKKLDPRHPSVESLVVYSLKGEILSSSKNEDVGNDIKLLNLNDSFLIKVRKQVIDEALALLKKEYPNRQWTKYLFDKEIEKWQSKYKGKFRPYCQAAIWFLELLKKSNRYPAK